MLPVRLHRSEVPISAFPDTYFDHAVEWISKSAQSRRKPTGTGVPGLERFGKLKLRNCPRGLAPLIPRQLLRQRGSEYASWKQSSASFGPVREHDIQSPHSGAPFIGLLPPTLDGEHLQLLGVRAIDDEFEECSFSSKVETDRRVIRVLVKSHDPLRRLVAHSFP